MLQQKLGGQSSVLWRREMTLNFNCQFCLLYRRLTRGKRQHGAMRILFGPGSDSASSLHKQPSSLCDVTDMLLLFDGQYAAQSPIC